MNAAAAPADLRIDSNGAVVRLTLARPAAANCLSRATMAALAAALAAADADTGCRAVVITGSGDRVFCAGADLHDASLFEPEATTPAPFAQLLRALRTVDIPVIARVNGSAFGGGVGLLGLCDFVIAADDARFVISEIDIGLFPTQVVSALQRTLQRARLVRMCMTGEAIGAVDALATGLVGEVVPRTSLDAAVARLLDVLLAKPAEALRRGKQMLRAIEAAPFDESLRRTEAVLQAQLRDPAAAERLRTLRERRRRP
ncbi:MAG: enoyl-CoA hydratase-related protein [Lautropia sp.]